MPPKDLIKSMQTYARFLDNALEQIDHVLTRVPAEVAEAKAKGQGKGSTPQGPGPRPQDGQV